MEMPIGRYLSHHHRHQPFTMNNATACQIPQPQHQSELGVSYLNHVVTPDRIAVSHCGITRTPLAGTALVGSALAGTALVTAVQQRDWMIASQSEQSASKNDDVGTVAGTGSDVTEPLKLADAAECKMEPLGGRRRNARERNRVRTINSTFARLRQKLPLTAAYSVAPRRRPTTVELSSGVQAMTSTYRARKLSKVQILRAAINYIRTLQDELNSHPHTRQRFALSNTTRYQFPQHHLHLQQQQRQYHHHHCYIR